MNKHLVFLALLSSLFLSMACVLAVDSEQIASVTGTENQIVVAFGSAVINLTLNTVSFGYVIPGTSQVKNSNLTLDPSNNMNLSIEISFYSEPNSLFQNKRLQIDTANYGGTGYVPIPNFGNGSVSLKIQDKDADMVGSSQINIIPMQLTVPTGTLPGFRQAILRYFISSAPPISR